MAAIAFFPLFGSGIINSSSTRKQNHFGINNQPFSRWRTCIVCEFSQANIGDHNSSGDPCKCCKLYLQSGTKMKVKNDHRSRFSNLSNWKEEAWKNQAFNGIGKSTAMIILHFHLQLQFKMNYFIYFTWTKMLRKLDVTMSSFKIKLLRALATTNTAPRPPKKNNVEVRVDHVWPWPNVLDQGGARGGNIAVKSRTLRRQLQLHNWLHVIIPSQPTTATASQLSIWDATNKVTYLRIIYF